MHIFCSKIILTRILFLFAEINLATWGPLYTCLVFVACVFLPMLLIFGFTYLGPDSMFQFFRFCWGYFLWILVSFYYFVKDIDYVFSNLIQSMIIECSDRQIWWEANSEAAYETDYLSYTPSLPLLFWIRRKAVHVL